jgi:nucleotide-binding universal stress UspA family protein
MEMHLLHVRTPFSRHVALFTSRRNRESYHREMAERALKSARALLNQHGIPHTVHVEVGDKAEIIDRLARRLHVDKIVMGTARKNSLTRLIEDSVSSKVLDTACAPVEIVVGQSVSQFERVGVLASVAAALVFIVAAAV